MSVQVVFETHATSEDNEAEIRDRLAAGLALGGGLICD